MNEEKKGHYPWETLDTTMLFLPEELLAYHIYRLMREAKNKKKNGNSQEKKYIKYYLSKDELETREVKTCSQKL